MREKKKKQFHAVSTTANSLSTRFERRIWRARARDAVYWTIRELMQYRSSFPTYHSQRIDVLGRPRTSFRWLSLARRIAPCRAARDAAHFQNVPVHTADTIGPQLEWIMLTPADGKRSGN